MEPGAKKFQTPSRLVFDEFSPRLQDRLSARVERLGYVGEFFRCTAHQPSILEPFLEMTEALKQALPDRLTEVGALTIATIMENAYERNQHERLSIKLGLTETWVRSVERVDPDHAPGLSHEERAVQRLIVALIQRRGKDVSEEFSDLIDAVGEDQAIAILFLTGRYVTHALIVNALELAPPVPSIFASEPS